MTELELLALIGCFLFVLLLGGLWADAGDTDAHSDARRRNQAWRL